MPENSLRLLQASGDIGRDAAAGFALGGGGAPASAQPCFQDSRQPPVIINLGKRAGRAKKPETILSQPFAVGYRRGDK